MVSITNFMMEHPNLMPFIYTGIFTATFFLGFIFTAALRKARNAFGSYLKFKKESSPQKEGKEKKEE